MVRCLRSGSSGCRIGDNSKFAPVCAGDHLSMIAPCGKPMKANRFGVAPAGVCAQTVAAGFIASRSGSAIVAPTPFNTVRRETCFLDRYIGISASNANSHALLPGHLRTLGARGWLRHPAHPELLAANHCLRDTREPVIAVGRAVDDPPD